jgi:hypothetical protein
MVVVFVDALQTAIGLAGLSSPFPEHYAVVKDVHDAQVHVIIII